MSKPLGRGQLPARWIKASELEAANAAGKSLGISGANVALMPWLNEGPARTAARVMLHRAGAPLLLVGLQDDLARGSVALLNAAVRQVDSAWITYTAEDAFAGRYWLRYALAQVHTAPQKSLFAFNDGKWFGELAGFGMVRRTWLNTIYGGDLFFPGYRQHYGDTELSMIARQQEALAYHPHAVLVEVDPDKDAKPVNPADRSLFQHRSKSGFDGRVRNLQIATLFA
jgi:hypothetical protein